MSGPFLFGTVVECVCLSDRCTCESVVVELYNDLAVRQSLDENTLYQNGCPDGHCPEHVDPPQGCDMVGL